MGYKPGAGSGAVGPPGPAAGSLQFLTPLALNGDHAVHATSGALVGSFAPLADPVFYVDPAAGNDANAGGIATPFLTVNKALTSLNPGWTGVATINLRAGTNTIGANTVFPAPVGNTNATAGGLVVNGVDNTDSGLGARTSAGGTAGQISTAAVFGTVIDSVGGLGVNAYQGSFIRFTSGASLNGKSFQVATNTATTFTVAGTLPVAPTTETFVVETPAAALSWAGTQVMQAAGVVGFVNVQFTGPGGANALRFSRGTFGQQKCRFATLGTGGIQLRNGAQLTDTFALTNQLGGLSITQQCGSFFNGAPISPTMGSSTGVYGGGLNLNRCVFVDSNTECFAPIQLQFRSSYFTGNSYIRCAYKPQLLTSGNIHSAVTPAPSIPSVVVGATGGAIVVSKGANASINVSDISNTPAAGTNGDAIVIEDGSMADVSTVTGAGNAGLGARVTRQSSIRSNLANTVTGTADLQIGSNATTTWASITPGTFQTDLVQLCLASHHT